MCVHALASSFVVAGDEGHIKVAENVGDVEVEHKAGDRENFNLNQIEASTIHSY